jgi:hypothetical protein
MYSISLIAGPTLTGKTDLAIRLAVRSDAILLPIDQLQMYTNLSLGVGFDHAALRRVDTYGYQTLSPWDRFPPDTYVRWLRDAILKFASDRPVVIEGGCTSYLSELVRARDRDPLLRAIKITALSLEDDKGECLDRIKRFYSQERVSAIIGEAESLRRSGFYDDTGLELFRRCENLFTHPTFQHMGLAWALRISARIYYPAHLGSVAQLSQSAVQARIIRNVVRIHQYQERRIRSFLRPDEICSYKDAMRIAAG